MFVLGLWISLALFAFAANSLLCRAAIAYNAMDPITFTALRLLSGALVLSLILRAKRPWAGGSWRGSIALLVYALAFASAYTQLGAATGAILLFTTVQLTMLGFSLRNGVRLQLRQGVGCAMAFTGLLWLTWPKASLPSLGPASLMILAGIAWAFYSLLGRSSQSPLADTCGNFVRSAPLMLFALLVMLGQSTPVTSEGLLVSLLSGGVASGLGYAIWYRVLPRLDAWQAGFLQLFSPPLAAIGAVLWLGEAMTLSLAGATLLCILGLFLILRRPGNPHHTRQDRQSPSPLQNTHALTEKKTSQEYS